MSLEAKGIRKSKVFLGSTREPVQGEGGAKKSAGLRTMRSSPGIFLVQGSMCVSVSPKPSEYIFYFEWLIAGETTHDLMNRCV